jgi:hypothetical protein
MVECSSSTGTITMTLPRFTGSPTHLPWFHQIGATSTSPLWISRETSKKVRNIHQDSPFATLSLHFHQPDSYVKGAILKWCDIRSYVFMYMYLSVESPWMGYLEEV